MSVDRDTLDFMVYDIGVEAAMSLYKLTEKQFNAIMYGKPVAKEGNFEFKPDKKYVEFERSTSPDLEHLERVITNHYKGIYKRFVAKKYNINTRSLSQEDILQAGLLSILKNASSFHYSNDEDTLRFIHRALKNDRINAMKTAQLTPKTTAIINDMVAGFHIEHSLDGDAIDNLFDRCPLTPNQREIATRLVQGYRQDEIAVSLGVSRMTVSTNKRKLKEYLK